MKLDQVQAVVDRVKRFSSSLDSKVGDGFNYSYQFDDGSECLYTINGVKSPEVIEDVVTTMFVWLWSLKDYIKKYASAHSKTGRWVEDKINLNSELCICADIANGLKHGGLGAGFTPRSSLGPSLGKVRYTFPQQSIASLTFGASSVGFDITQAENVVLEVPVYDKAGNKIDDAFNLVSKIVDSWERMLSAV